MELLVNIIAEVIITSQEISEEDKIIRLKTIRKVIQLNEQNDVSLIIVGCEYLSELLHNFLMDMILGSKKQKEQLLNSMGPLSSFSARIKIAYSFGLITKILFNELEKLRKIRNIFAHSLDPIDFNEPKIVELSNELYYPKIHEDIVGSSDKISFSIFYAFLNIGTFHQETDKIQEKISKWDEKQDKSEVEDAIRNFLNQ